MISKLVPIYPAWQRFFPSLKRRKRNLCTDLLDAVQNFRRINWLRTGLKPVITSSNFNTYHNVEQPLGCYELAVFIRWQSLSLRSRMLDRIPSISVLRFLFLLFREEKTSAKQGSPHFVEAVKPEVLITWYYFKLH